MLGCEGQKRSLGCHARAKNGSMADAPGLDRGKQEEELTMRVALGSIVRYTLTVSDVEAHARRGCWSWPEKVELAEA